MALTVQSIANDINLALRQAHGALTVDLSDPTLLALYLMYINQAQQDVFHTSHWKSQLLTSETFQSIVDGSPYVLNVNNIRQIISVHDLKNRTTLIPYHDITYPAATSASPPERSGPPRNRFELAQETSGLQPKYYSFEACLEVENTEATITQGIHLFPDPKDTAHQGGIRFFYTKMVPQLTDIDDELLLPEDGKDILVACGAMYLSRFIGEEADAAFWASVYDRMRQN